MVQDLNTLKKLILYIAELCKDKSNFGATHLNKILYFSDFFHYKYTGKSISGASYFKLERGPAPRHLIKASEELIADGRLEIKEVPTLGGYKQKRSVPIGFVDDTFLEDWQKELIASIADQACDQKATILSLISHKHLAWELAELHQDIPFFTIHCTQVNQITTSSKNWAIQLASKARIITA